MDAKTIGFGVAVVVASVGGSALVSKSTTELTIKAGATTQDVAVTDIAKIKADSNLPRTCERAWAQVDDMKELQAGWMCEGAWMPASVSAELDKMAGEDGIRIVLTPHQDGEQVVYNASVTKGALPEKPAAKVTEALKVDE
jgi:hypothetical protein